MLKNSLQVRRQASLRCDSKKMDRHFVIVISDLMHVHQPMLTGREPSIFSAQTRLRTCILKHGILIQEYVGCPGSWMESKLTVGQVFAVPDASATDVAIGQTPSQARHSRLRSMGSKGPLTDVHSSSSSDVALLSSSPSTDRTFGEMYQERKGRPRECDLVTTLRPSDSESDPS